MQPKWWLEDEDECDLVEEEGNELEFLGLHDKINMGSDWLGISHEPGLAFFMSEPDFDMPSNPASEGRHAEWLSVYCREHRSET